MTMKQFKIIDVDICDHNPPLGFFDGLTGETTWRPSCVEVHVTIELTAKKYSGKQFILNYQTSNTNDVGAYSSRLEVNDQSGDDSDEIIKIVGEEEAPEFFENVLIKSQAQQKWINYINDNYQLSNIDNYREIIILMTIINSPI